MAKKIFELAKELGVDSKAILSKCWDEGISKDVVKGHMSAIGPGLEASIRDWFSSPTEEVAHTAVETSSKVDIDKVKSRSARKRSAKKDEHDEGPHDEDDHGAAVTVTLDAPAPPPAEPVTTPPTPAAAEPVARAPEPATAPHEAESHHVKATPVKVETLVAAVPPTLQRPTTARPPEPVRTPEPAQQPPARTVPPHVSSPATGAPVPPLRPEADDAAPASSAVTPVRVVPPAGGESRSSPLATPAPTSGTTPLVGASNAGSTGLNATSASGQGASMAPSTGPGRPMDQGRGPLGPRADGGQGGRGPLGPRADGGQGRYPGSRPQGSGASGAQQNVPNRPTVVSPAGPKLENRAPVALRGPKVVRIEAPEQLEAPRARRPGGPAGPGGPSTIPSARGPRTGDGAGGGGGEDDRVRSPRRKPMQPPQQTPASKRSSGQGVPQRRRATSGEEWVGGQVFTEQDMIEREERLAKAGGFLKKRKHELKKPGQSSAPDASEGRIRISAPFTIKDLSETTGVKASEIVKKLFLQGIMKKINDPIEVEKAIEIMMDFEIDLEVVEAKTAEEAISSEFADKRTAKDVRARGPVVTILGHVDHGKTSLLDRIRNANVAAGEAGGITQKTSAFVADVEVEGQTRQIVFLDTPGHEAFTSMRSRGAKLTDVVVLVVSAPEGVMPQTIESINHAKAAKVPIVVALNKIDRPDATESIVQKNLGLLAEHGLNPAEWGGDTEVVRTSATTGRGIPELLQALDYQAQLLELKADVDGPAIGTVIEAKMEEGRGAVANLLIQQGKLKVGDFVVMGRGFGRVRDMTNDRGERIREALPPMPVQISGIDEVCDAGDKFYVVDSLRKAQDAAEQRRSRERQAALAAPKLTLDSLFTQIQSQETDTKEIKIVLKTDQQGTVDVLKLECEKVKTPEVRVRVLHSAVGGITESDVLLADASKAIIIGFNVIPSGKARQLAESKGVEIRTYQVIYDITDDLKKAAEGMLAPEIREEVLGHADVRAVFRISKVGSVAGCYVTDGTVQRDALIRVTRNGVVIEHDRRLSQLKRVKDDAKEVRAGVECGMKIDGYDDIKEGDVLECYRKVEHKRTL